MINTLGIVGVGLLGGSLALAIKQRHVAQCVLGNHEMNALRRDTSKPELSWLFVESPAFGRISSAGSPRHIQFGLKMLF